MAARPRASGGTFRVTPKLNHYFNFSTLACSFAVNTEDKNLLSISTLFSAMKNHWFPAMVVFVVTIVLAILAMIFLPRSYVSEAMIFVKLGRETVSLDPTATTGSTISVLDTRDNEINSIRDMLYSRGLVERVVDRIGPEVILGDAEISAEIKERDPLEKDYLNSTRQKAIKTLIEDAYVVSSRKSSVLILHVRAASPELAQRIVKEYLDVYQIMHTSAHQTPESNDFFGEQSQLKRRQWQETMKALQVAKEDAGVVSIEGARENLKEQTHTIESSLMGTISSLSATRARLNKFKALVNKNPLSQQRVSADYVEAKADFSALLAQKATLEGQLDELLDKAAKLNRNEVLIGQLQATVEKQADSYSQYLELYEQSRIDEALHSSRFTNVRIVQQPSFVPKPVSPKKSIIAALGLVAATSGAVTIAVLLELLGIYRIQRNRPAPNSSSIPDSGEFLAGPSIANG